MKLRGALTYLNIDHDAGYKKRTSFKGGNSYTQNMSYTRSLIDTGFIPLPGADTNNPIHIVGNNYSVYNPDIFNSTTDKFGEDNEE